MKQKELMEELERLDPNLKRKRIKEQLLNLPEVITPEELALYYRNTWED